MQGVRWNSKAAFIFATAAAAIGLGNVWRFTFVVGENGGGAFVLIYLLCVIGLGLPLMLAEIVMGRLHRSHPVAVTQTLAISSGRTRHWGWLGVLMLLSIFLILSYYVVIVGWVLYYGLHALSHGYVGMTVSLAKNEFSSFSANPVWSIGMTALVIITGCVILALGVKKGLERAVMLMFPVMLILMLALIVYSIFKANFMQGLAYLFRPDFSKINTDTILSALGQAFFSLNIAIGVTCMFSAYLPENVSVVRAALWVTFADTGFALLAGLIIFPFVITYGLPFKSGPGLVFETLPVAFSHMAVGRMVGILFFIMLFFAAFSSVIALQEPILSWLEDRFKLTRRRSVFILGLAVFVISLGSVGSFCWPSHFTLHGITFSLLLMA